MKTTQTSQALKAKQAKPKHSSTAAEIKTMNFEQKQQQIQ